MDGVSISPESHGTFKQKAFSSTGTFAKGSDNVLSPSVFIRPPPDVIQRQKQFFHITLKGRKAYSLPRYWDILYF